MANFLTGGAIGMLCGLGLFFSSLQAARSWGATSTDILEWADERIGWIYGSALLSIAAVVGLIASDIPDLMQFIRIVVVVAAGTSLAGAVWFAATHAGGSPSVPLLLLVLCLQFVWAVVAPVIAFLYMIWLVVKFALDSPSR